MRGRRRKTEVLAQGEEVFLCGEQKKEEKNNLPTE